MLQMSCTFVVIKKSQVKSSTKNHKLTLQFDIFPPVNGMLWKNIKSFQASSAALIKFELAPKRAFEAIKVHAAMIN